MMPFLFCEKRLGGDYCRRVGGKFVDVTVYVRVTNVRRDDFPCVVARCVIH